MFVCEKKLSNHIRAELWAKGWRLLCKGEDFWREKLLLRKKMTYYYKEGKHQAKFDEIWKDVIESGDVKTPEGEVFYYTWLLLRGLMVGGGLSVMYGDNLRKLVLRYLAPYESDFEWLFELCDRIREDEMSGEYEYWPWKTDSEYNELCDYMEALMDGVVLHVFRKGGTVEKKKALIEKRSKLRARRRARSARKRASDARKRESSTRLRAGRTRLRGQKVKPCLPSRRSKRLVFKKKKK